MLGSHPNRAWARLDALLPRNGHSLSHARYIHVRDLVGRQQLRVEPCYDGEGDARVIACEAAIEPVIIREGAARRTEDECIGRREALREP